jgi:hypothetical protein
MEIHNSISSQETTTRFSLPAQSARPRPSISAVSNFSPEGGRNRSYTNQTNVQLFSNKFPAADATDQLINEIQRENDRHNNKFTLQNIFTFTSHYDYAKRIHELLVQKQTEEHETPGFLFNFIVQNDLVGLKDILEAMRKESKQMGRFRHESTDFILVDARDVAGGNIIHAAYLYQKYNIGRYLVESYPDIALVSPSVNNRYITHAIYIIHILYIINILYNLFIHL